MSDSSSSYDIAIVGGGMVGATLACALGKMSLRIALVEAKRPAMDWPQDDMDRRVSALTAGSVHIFDTLGLWQPMVERRVSPFREMHVWDAGGPGVLHFDSADIGMDTLGYIVENRVIQAALHERIREFTNIEWFNSARISALQCDAEQVHLAIEDGRTINTRLVVGADGPGSAVRHLAGIATHGWDHQQTAIVATVKTANSHRETAWQCFLPEGPLAFLPLMEGYSSIVWTVAPHHARQLLALDDAYFIAELQAALAPDGQIPGTAVGLGAIQSVGPRAAFPLRLIHADDYVRARLALVGDAAHTVHPLAGQGVNLGLSDVAVLAQVLSEALAQQADLGGLLMLRRYERWRKGDNVMMVAALEGIRHLFGDRLPPVRWLRNVGLQLTNAATPVKNLIMRHAMGLTGDLPKLARGFPL